MNSARPHPQSDERYAYIFVRQDLSLAQQIVQANHATMLMTSQTPGIGLPNLVVIGVPDKDALDRVSRKLIFHKIRHYLYFEPDDYIGHSAIATVPITVEEKKVLSNYRLWKPTPGERRNPLGSSVGTPAPDSPVAQA